MTARALVIAPNPSASSARITLMGSAPLADQPARLEITDVSGRLVRVIQGSSRGYLAQVWQRICKRLTRDVHPKDP